MKDLSQFINEAHNKCMFNVIQYETNENSSYSTVGLSEGKKNYKHVWVCINDDSEWISVTAANTALELQDVLGLDLKDCEALIDMKVLTSKEVESNNGSLETWLKVY